MAIKHLCHHFQRVRMEYEEGRDDRPREELMVDQTFYELPHAWCV